MHAFSPPADRGEASPDEKSASSALPVAVVLFATNRPDRNISGLPLAARMARELDMAGIEHLCFVTPAGDMPSAATVVEIDRLAPHLTIRWLSAGAWASQARRWPQALTFSDAFLPEAEGISAWLEGDAACWVEDGSLVAWREDGSATGFEGGAALPVDRAGAILLKRTAKAGDGIVSRWINRPISRAISRLFLLVPAARPVHATMLTAVLAVLMFFCLLIDGRLGLILGPILFQAASVIDGVDGEMARVTFRSSHRGAVLDSSVDMITNLLFVAGVTIHFAMEGRQMLMLEAIASLVSMATGIAIVGWMARRGGGDPGFNLLKSRLYDRFPSGIGHGIARALVYVTSRDFFAFMLMLMFVADMEEVVVPIATSVACLWLLFVLAWVPAALWASKRAENRL